MKGALVVLNLVCATAPALIWRDAEATSFGETTIVQSWFDPTCLAYYTPVSVPIVVGATSRIFARATLAGATHPQDMYVLVGSLEGTVLGVTINSTNLSSTSDPLITEGVLHDGPTPLDSAAPALVLAPGTYLLQVRYTAAPFCTSGEGVRLSVLTYVMLSASFDRIFADGFA
jgi:hypothetical protein